MNFDTICNILSSDAFISVNKTLAKKIGIIPAVVLAELISEQRYWTIRKELTSDGYFFSTISNLEENCGIKRSQQDTAIQVLIEKNLISYQVKKYPRRRFFKINNFEVFEILKEETLEKKEEDLSEPDLTKVRKDVKIFLESFKEAYKTIDKDYFQFLCLSDNYKMKKEDVEVLEKFSPEDIKIFTKTLNDLNYTIDHSGAFNYWKADMPFSIRVFFKIPFRYNALLEFGKSLA